MISAFVASYGYLAVFAGALLEGETLLLAAGFAAHRGLLDWPLVVLVAMLGATTGDQLAFLLSRWKGDSLVRRFPALLKQKPRVDRLLDRHAVLCIVGVRFLYGLRIAGPVLMGSSRIPTMRFAFFNMIGAALWATTIAGAGYIFGAAVEALVADLKRVEEIILIGILVAGGLYWAGRRYVGSGGERDT